MGTDHSKLTVLMAVHNGGPFLVTAIDSILSQSYQDFNFLIVDDASTDGTREVIKSYQDPRIQLVCLERNVGQTAALNVGLRQASTPWIARMDADDFSAPTRFQEQMQALDADPSLKCVGTFAWTFRDDPNVVEEVLTNPLHHDDIRSVVAKSPMIHGTIVVSRAAMLDIGLYAARYRYSADLEMYDRLLAKYRAANIPRQLLGIRHHSGQRSRTRVALDEIIEIYACRIAANRYSQEDLSVIRQNLCRSHVERARHMTGEARPSEVFKDLARALRLSPGSSLWYFFKVFMLYTIGHRHRAKLKSLLTQIAPRRAR